MSYKSVYVWPNPAFPFRLYFESDKLRIFIIENLQHNYTWIKQYKRHFKETDRFIVIVGSHWSEYLIKNASDMFDYLSLDRDKFFVLFNDHRDQDLFEKWGFKGQLINQNAWLDYNQVMDVDITSEKKFDAIYVGRLIAVKRHELAVNVKNLALVSGPLHGNTSQVVIPEHIYRNTEPLPPVEVKRKINESYCGLLLSDKEGACFSSSEYLLCGIPVVSTHSEGGRDVWYSSYNSKVVDADPSSIADAVEYFKNNPRDPFKIRNEHISKSMYFRNKFIAYLGDLFSDMGVKIDSRKYFEENYFHKMRTSYAPVFEDIFK